MRLTDEIDNIWTPAKDLRAYEYGPFSDSTVRVHTQASTMVTSSHYQNSQSSLLRNPIGIRYRTQKPALDVHLDNKRRATASVGRRSNGTDAPMTWPLRSCDNSAGDKVGSGVAMVGIVTVTARGSASRLSSPVGEKRKPRHSAVPWFHISSLQWREEN